MSTALTIDAADQLRDLADRSERAAETALRAQHCPCFTWDPTKSLSELAASAKVIDLHLTGQEDPEEGGDGP